jgi:hypothetical protein
VLSTNRRGLASVADCKPTLSHAQHLPTAPRKPYRRVHRTTAYRRRARKQRGAQTNARVRPANNSTVSYERCRRAFRSVTSSSIAQHRVSRQRCTTASNPTGPHWGLQTEMHSGIESDWTPLGSPDRDEQWHQIRLDPYKPAMARATALNDRNRLTIR